MTEPGGFAASVTIDGDVVTVTISGEADLAARADFNSALESALASGASRRAGPPGGHAQRPGHRPPGARRRRSDGGPGRGLKRSTPDGARPMGHVMRTDRWRDQGRCKGADPEVFHPEDDEDPGDAAKAICAPCPVREVCLEHALAVREKIGVWGGYTAKERRRLIRQRRRAS
jgi:WhiB family redox-sensing transcriptional regulator